MKCTLIILIYEFVSKVLWIWWRCWDVASNRFHRELLRDKDFLGFKEKPWESQRRWLVSPFGQHSQTRASLLLRMLNAGRRGKGVRLWNKFPSFLKSLLTTCAFRMSNIVFSTEFQKLVTAATAMQMIPVHGLNRPYGTGNLPLKILRWKCKPCEHGIRGLEQLSVEGDTHLFPTTHLKGSFYSRALPTKKDHGCSRN